MTVRLIAPVVGGRQGRTDQGVDFSGVGATVHALGDGVIKSVGRWGGWPGTGGLVYSTGGRNIFIQEDFIPASSLRPGQKITAGQILGKIGAGTSGIEMGFANPAGTAPLVRYNGLPDGTPTAGGKAFAAWIKGAAGGHALDPKPGNGPLGIPGAIRGAADAVAGAPAAAANAAFGGLWDAVSKDATRALLYVVLVGAGVALALGGINHALGGAPARAASHVPIPVPV